jgi:hypothetical protein
MTRIAGLIMWTRITATTICLGLAGCEGDGLERHQVSGTVSYQGRPVEYGTIVFEPEASAGQIAPTSFARIESGKYQTERAESPTTGRYNVRVMGFDKAKMKQNTPPEEIIELPELFPAYSVSVEIPPPDDRLDIEVPSKGR